MSAPERRENNPKRRYGSRFPTRAELDQMKSEIQNKNVSNGPQKLSRPVEDYSFMKDTSPEEYSPEQQKLSAEFIGHTADWLKGQK